MLYIHYTFVHIILSYYLRMDYNEIMLAGGVDERGRSARVYQKRISFRRPVYYNANICCAKCTHTIPI